ncbi:MAG: DUF1045 domain-containing protein [Candidatus Nomurabacteria bacterium]
MENEKVFISITLIPEEKIENLVLKINEDLSEKFSINKPDSNKEYAHISLYNANFPSHNRLLIENIIEDISKSFSNIELVPEYINSKSRFISIVFHKTEIIENLQNKIIEMLNPLREGLLQSEYTEKTESYSEKELFLVKMYGYPFCKEEFTPHMTLVELNDIEDTSSILKEIVWNKNVSIDKISMRIISKNEIGEKVVKTILFKLKSI